MIVVGGACIIRSLLGYEKHTVNMFYSLSFVATMLFMDAQCRFLYINSFF